MTARDIELTREENDPWSSYFHWWDYDVCPRCGANLRKNSV